MQEIFIYKLFTCLIVILISSCESRVPTKIFYHEHSFHMHYLYCFDVYVQGICISNTNICNQNFLTFEKRVGIDD